MKSKQKVFTHVLKNGLTVLVRPTHNVPKVSVQLWYNVGSKDEQSGKTGLAHLIEHMIFKGTKKLSESDINMITHKLSGSCNAFTSYDYTGYLFDFPSHHWHEAFPIMADCMRNCTFKKEMLNSELKAVVQELKMYNDNFTSSLVEKMLASIFSEHPYHHPVIGYKTDLLEVEQKDLLDFYGHHYVPNNAALVVVGDVEVHDVVARAEKEFGGIKPNKDYQSKKYFEQEDIVAKSVTMKRAVQQPAAMFAFTVPGAREKYDYAFDSLSNILGAGKSSRLYKKLVDEHRLATEVEAFSYDLFDKGIFFIYVQPVSADYSNMEKIIEVINGEISSIINKGFKPGELDRAARLAKTSLLSTLENNQRQAYLIGKSYMATGDPEYLFNYLEQSIESVGKQIRSLLEENFLPSLMHKGAILSLDDNEKKYWEKVQKQSDEQDTQILSRKERTSKVEDGSYVNNVHVQMQKSFEFPKANRFILPNGLTVLYYNNPSLPKIQMVLDLKAKHHYDPEKQQGLYYFMTEMMSEGTKSYPGRKLADEVESLGMYLGITPGGVSLGMLRDDFEKGLHILADVLTSPEFSKSALEKTQTKIITSLKNFWDTPMMFSSQLLKDFVYKNHPYHKNFFGTEDVISSVKQSDLRQCFDTFVSPKDAVLAVVGDLSGCDIEKLLEKYLCGWSGESVQSPCYPKLENQKSKNINYKISRDQVALAFAGLSIDRYDKEFDNLLLFDQIFGGGSLGSMSSRLFQLREETGLFYTISGSLLAMSGEQPGMSMVKTLVSLDRLDQAEKVIKKTIDTAADKVSDDEFEQAQNAIANNLVSNFESNISIASSFLFLERYKFPQNFFDNRANNLRKVTKKQMQDSAKKILDTKHMCTLKVGRV